MTEKLTRMAAGEEGLHQLEADLAAKAAAYCAAAEKLTAQRREAARRLDHAVATELAPLKLDAARFRTLVEPLDESQWTARGADRVELEIDRKNVVSGRGGEVRVDLGGRVTMH